MESVELLMYTASQHYLYGPFLPTVSAAIMLDESQLPFSMVVLRDVVAIVAQLLAANL